MIVKEEREELLSYLEDSSNFKNGNAEKLYIPENEAEIVEIVKECSEKKIPLTVSGGGTGTVGGRIPEEGYIISMEKLNIIKSIDEKNKSAIVQAGVVVDEFLKIIDEKGLFYPPFPTERSAFLGGNVATNASGEYSFRFGPTRKYVEKIRMILTTGKILEIERGKLFEKDGFIDYGEFKVPLPSYTTPDIKCSAGYYSKKGMDGIDLIIGSEGTLGIITEIEVSLIDALPPRFIIILFFKSEEKVVEIVKNIKKEKDLLEIYSLEFFDKRSLQFLKNDFPEIPDNNCAIYCEAVSDIEKMERWVEIADRFNASDTWIGEDKVNYEKLIEFRHRLPENINSYFKKIGSTKISVDVAVPENKFPQIYEFYSELIKTSSLHMVRFGHIGENHLHFNIFPVNEKEKKEAMEIYIKCIEKGISLGGTVSAEHGIGKLKHKYLELMYGKDGIMDMIKIKKIFDPFCILGLNNIFPKEYLSPKFCTNKILS